MPAGFSNAARRLASPQMQARFQSRIAEFAGLVLGIAGISLALALLTYSPADPSFDTATVGPVRNIAGHPGADVADLLLQWFGLAGALPAICLLAWAWRIASHRGLDPLTLRLAALFAALPAAAGTMAAIPGLLGRTPAWPSEAGTGGAVGNAIASHVLAAGSGFLGPLGGGLVTLFGLVLSALLVALAFGLSAREWRTGAGLGAAIFTVPARMALGRSGRTRRRRDAGRSGARLPVPAQAYAIELAEPPPERDIGALPVRRAMVAPEPDAEPATPRLQAPASSRPGARLRAARPGDATTDSDWTADRPPGRAARPDRMPAAPAPGNAVPGAAPNPVSDAAADTDEAPVIALPAPARASTEAPRTEPTLRLASADRDRKPPRFGAFSAVRRLVGLAETGPAPQEPAIGRFAETGRLEAGGLRRDRFAPEPDPWDRDRRTAAGAPGVPSSQTGAQPARLSRHVAPSQPAPGASAPREPSWRLPPVGLLRTAPPHAAFGPSSQLLEANARLLETVLADYGVQGQIRDIRTGPVVSLYELEPAPGIRSARVIGLADDVARSLSVTAVRIATVPGRNVIGIEVPNARRETVFLSELLGSREFSTHPARLVLALGKDISGAPILADLARMPHLLIAGTTGSGKSVGVNAMIASLLYRLSPDECRLILIDPKMLELSVYDGIPHLMAPVVTEPKKAVTALKWTVREMERRYRAMSQLGVRNVAGYNEKAAEARARGEVISRRVQTGFDSETGKPTYEEQRLDLKSLPFLVVVIDEMADLMMVAGKEIEAAVQRLAQMARAAGIHVIMATQRPSVDVITGTIKANFPTRISFQVISKFDSRTILGEQGAEQLLGQGDMLHMQAGGRINRIHGPFVEDLEVEKIVAWLKEQGSPDYLDEVTEGEDEEESGAPRGGRGADPQGNLLDETSLFDQAVSVVAREGKASTSFLQRHLSIGYNRAAKLIEQMEKEGIVSPANHVGRREVLVRRTNEDD